MGKNEFYFLSSDGHTNLRAIEWKADDAKAVVELVHGIAEHIERYDGFASFLAENGITVVGFDLLGHGKSAAKEEDLGFFAEDDGWFKNVEDVHSLRRLTAEKYPDKPYFILGHSMGSFLVRTYITKYADGLAGAIISGTGANPEPVLALGRAVAKAVMKKGGIRVRSETIRKMCFGSYNKEIENPKNENEWLSRDLSVSEKYCADPLCGFLPCAEVYYEMFRGISYIQKKENIAKVPKKLPLFFFSGSMDPVGGYSDGVIKAYNSYNNAGLTDTKIKLYAGGRHEMLNETNKDEVYASVLKWIESKI